MEIVAKNVRRIEDLMLIWRSNDRTVLSIYSYCAIRDKISLHKQDQMRPTTQVQDGEEERFRNFLRLHVSNNRNVSFSGVERGIGSLVMGIWHLKPFSSTSSHVIYLLLRDALEIKGDEIYRNNHNKRVKGIWSDNMRQLDTNEN
ncbi:hypothetical protein Tco_0970692 [Tanacetum coccineum]